MVAKRNYVASWRQLGDRLSVTLAEQRECKGLVHTPVVRVETIHNRADSTLIWEYIMGTGLAGFSVFAFTRPEMFGTRYVNETGALVYDEGAGRRVGTVFATMGAILLASAIYDTARSLDRTTYADAYRVDVGGPRPCADPIAPVQRHAVELVVDDYRVDATTDEHGQVEFTLPPRTARAPGSESPRVRPAAIRVDDTHAVAVDYRIPYDAGGPPHTGPARERLDIFAPVRPTNPAQPPAGGSLDELETQREVGPQAERDESTTTDVQPNPTTSTNASSPEPSPR